MPYAWQKPGASLSCLSNSNGHRHTVLGFLSCLGSFRSYMIDGYGTGELIVACIDQFVGCLKRRRHRRPVVLVLDNASLHTSGMFQQRRAVWAKADVNVKYLPQYSPELNMIEILWKRIKYSRLPLDAYENWEKLTESLEHILKNIGRKYQISFS
ncbi:MAG: transposase [Chlorobi bacterium]|nr:transposase [Chlorobiota bacterium]